MEYTMEQLENHIGKPVWYSGGWGNEVPIKAILDNVEFDDSKGEIVVDVEICENGHTHWGYLYQIELIQEKEK